MSSPTSIVLPYRPEPGQRRIYMPSVLRAAYVASGEDWDFFPWIVTIEGRVEWFCHSREMAFSVMRTRQLQGQQCCAQPSDPTTPFDPSAPYDPTAFA